MGAGFAGHLDILPAVLVEVGDPNLQADFGPSQEGPCGV
jgi:hypothetical protein